MGANPSICFYDNPLHTEPLRIEHIKPRLLAHWGTTPGLNFVYVHCNRVIKKYQDMPEIRNWSWPRT